MPINKTKPGTFTILGGDGTRENPWDFWAIYDENNSNLVNSAYNVNNIYVTRTIGLEYVKVVLQAGVNYYLQTHSDDDGWIKLYDKNWNEIRSDDDSCHWDYNFFNNGNFPFSATSYTPSTTDTYYIYGQNRSDGERRRIVFISPSPVYNENDLKKVYDTSPNFDKQGYMVDFFSLDEAEIKAPVVAQGGLDFDLSFQNGLTESLTGITGTIEDTTYFEMVNDEVVGDYLLCKKIRGSQRKVVFSGTENMFQYGTGDFTVSFWLKAPNFVGFGQSILSKHNGSTGFSIYNTVDNTSDTTMEMRVSQSNSNVDLSTNAVNESNWTHWLFMRENNKGYWYKNGTKISEVSMGERNVNNDSPLCLGFTNCAPYWGATFGITALRIYGKSMKDFEITALSSEFRI